MALGRWSRGENRTNLEVVIEEILQDKITADYSASGYFQEVPVGGSGP